MRFHRLAVRTTASHVVNRGSIPRGNAKLSALNVVIQDLRSCEKLSLDSLQSKVL